MRAPVDDRVVIVGAGQAGARAAEALRAAGHGGPIRLLGDERHLPYERPQLSKDVLLDSGYSIAPIKDREAWDKIGVEALPGANAVECDLDRRTVALDDGRRFVFDRLILATGVTARGLQEFEGTPAAVRRLRTVEDALHLRAAFRPNARIVMVGGGVIGLEAAVAARKAGADVTVVEAAATLLSRALPPIVAAALQRRHEAEGVSFRFGAVCKGFDNGAVVLADGSRLAADLVVVGIGAEPRDQLAQQMGLAAVEGIRVDAYGCTDAAGVYAVGDIAAQWHPRRKRWARVETWANAQNQAIATAKGLAGQRSPYLDPPWFWTDQYDLNVQVVGDLDDAELIVRGDPESDKFCVIGLDGDIVVGAVAVNNRKDMAKFRKLVAQQKRVVRADLENAAFDPRKSLV